MSISSLSSSSSMLCEDGYIAVAVVCVEASTPELKIGIEACVEQSRVTAALT